MRIVWGSRWILLFAPVAWLPFALAQSLQSTLPEVQTPELDARGKAMVEHHRRVRAEYRDRARRELLSEMKSEAGIREVAAERLRRNGADVFQMQRVEITGWFSPSPDDIEMRDRLYFNQRIALSNFVPPPADSGPVARAWRLARNFVVNGPWDITAEARYDRKGVFSARAMEQLQPISNVTIREIWAHSWATDAIYNAVLYGSVLPPKRLVLMGVTSQNVAKWESFAHATGTEVFIYGLDQDFVSRLPMEFKSVGVILGAGDFPGARAQNADELTRAWNAWVIANASRRRAHSSPGTVSTLWKVPASADFSWHTRDRYHDYLIQSLSWVVAVSVLADLQDQLIRDEKERMVNERTDRLLTESPPPPFGEPEWVAAQSQRQPVAVQAVVVPIAVQGRAVDRTGVRCLDSTLKSACESVQGLDRLPSICGSVATLLQASPAELRAAAARSTGNNTCVRALAMLMIEVPVSHGFYSVELLNQHVQTVRNRMASVTGAQSPSDGSPPANQNCHEECSDEPVCGPVTYERKCVSGFCFDAPRQHCSSSRVCRPVCQ